MEVGESSGSEPFDEVWAKLVPSDSGADVEIRSNETLVCSEIASSSSDKHEWCHITRNSDLCSATIKNTSPHLILVDGVAIHKEHAANIKCGSEIIPGSNGAGYLSYKFEVMPVEESCSKKLKISLDIEHTKCSICLNVWHDVVTVAPCLHNFCNGCFSEWLRRCQEKHSSVLCPHCRAVVQFVAKNHFLHNIEEDILQADSSLRRSKDELALLDSYASIKSNLIVSSRKKGNRKRTRSPVYTESEYGESEDSFYDETDEEHPCPQCGTEFGGFRCNADTIHLQCQACGGMMPSRTDISTPQLCLGCDRAFCGLYWHAQGFSGSDLYPVCSQDTFKPISQRTLSRIPAIAHDSNLFEQEITGKCIRKMGKTLQNVISDWLVKLDNREIDRTRMPLSHAEMITADTPLCNDCYDKLTSFLLYWFRVSMPTHMLPPEASKRENCWYGYACRTQHHSVDHARKRNHVCRPTRGSQTRS